LTPKIAALKNGNIAMKQIYSDWENGKLQNTDREEKFPFSFNSRRNYSHSCFPSNRKYLFKKQKRFKFVFKTLFLIKYK
jgi:hypothetical protein